MKSIFKITVFVLSILAGITVSSQLGLQSPGFVGQLSKKDSSSCATTDTTLPHDVFLEGFQGGAGDGNTWSISTVGTTANIEYAASDAKFSGVSGACSTAYKLTVPTDGTETYVQWTNAVVDIDGGSVDFVCYFYSESSPASGKLLTVAQITDGFGQNVVQLDYYQTSGLRAASYSTTGFITVSDDTLYKVVVHLDAATNLCHIAVGTTTNTFTRYMTRDVGRLRLGATGGLEAGDECGPLWFDVVAMDVP